ncbi:hypothetical protein NPX13_g6080 [Xylaria arbuscula]|uniref:Uncharacterized protein n=1 Tax=Xylaria arbuscula TaxID=114810 RepID=A0A9W8TKF9_9PEZI|nr:hypothetical protein NPX13_g6080 [Xylaria arbuscula]
MYVKSRHSDRDFGCGIDDFKPADHPSPQGTGPNPTSPLAETSQRPVHKTSSRDKTRDKETGSDRQGH